VMVRPVAGFSTTNWSSVEGDDQRVLVLVRAGACRVIGTSARSGMGVVGGRSARSTKLTLR
jgi:hypothetical protein